MKEFFLPARTSEARGVARDTGCQGIKGVEDCSARSFIILSGFQLKFPMLFRFNLPLSLFGDNDNCENYRVRLGVFCTNFIYVRTYFVRIANLSLTLNFNIFFFFFLHFAFKKIKELRETQQSFLSKDETNHLTLRTRAC